MSNFDEAIKVVMKHEGGFQKNPKDRGNWTTGEIGTGELRGTKYGISAMSYPGEDIEHLTEARAEEIYRKDFWEQGQYGAINDQSVANKLMDMAVNMERFGRHGPAVEILQKAICACGKIIDIDKSMGAKTILAANALPPDDLLLTMKREAVEHYEKIVANHPEDAEFLPGWKIRAMA